MLPAVFSTGVGNIIYEAIRRGDRKYALNFSLILRVYCAWNIFNLRALE